jgi:hypothetical protein
LEAGRRQAGAVEVEDEQDKGDEQRGVVGQRERGGRNLRSTTLGFKQPARRSINFPADNPYYDILLISRHERGLDLWNKTNPLPVDPQLSLLLGDEGNRPDEAD